MILTLALALLPVTERANAFVLTVAETLYIAGTILYSFGITYATDEDFRQGAKDFFYSCTDTVKKYIENIAIGAMSVPTFSYNIGCEIYKAISGDVVNYYNNYTGNTVKVTAGKNGHIGFTDDSKFTIHLNNFVDSTATRNTQVVHLNGMSIQFSDPERFDSFRAKWPVAGSDWFEQNFSDRLFSSTIVTVGNLSLSYYYFDDCQKDYWTAVFKFYGDYTSADKYLHLTYHVNGAEYLSSFELFKTCYTDGNEDRYLSSIYTVDGKACYLIKCDDGYYRFVTYDSAFGSESDYNYLAVTNPDTGKTYDKFADLTNFYSVVCEASGLDYPATKTTDEVNGDVYSPGAVPLTQNGVVPDVYNGTSDKTLTVPKSKAGTDVDVNDYGQIRTANPADVISDTTTIAYPDGVPEIDSSGLFDKFPFCIPYDIYNLFRGFSGNATPPKFSIPFRYGKQADGTYLVDYNFEIDFSQYELLAQILRWYISISFTAWLVLITRKVIGNN